jgi:hypothetical protein
MLVRRAALQRVLVRTMAKLMQFAPRREFSR